MTILATLLISLATAQPAGATPAPDRVVQNADTAIQAGNELLGRLETADRDIKTLVAGIQYTRRYTALEGEDMQVRRGTLVFDWPDGESKRFSIEFDSLWVDGAQRNDAQHYVFDGEWLVEKLPELKQVNRRQVVPPGQRIDPLRIGEGPFAIPIGQKRAEILQRFEAQKRPSLEDLDGESMKVGTRARYQAMEQLRLVPRVGTPEARDYKEIRIWFDRPFASLPKEGEVRDAAESADRLLPRLVRTVNSDGSKAEVLLVEFRLNGPIPTGAFESATPAGWREQIEPYRQGIEVETQVIDKSEQTGQ